MIITKAYSIGGVRLSLSWDPAISQISLDPSLSAFSSPMQENTPADITFSVFEHNSTDFSLYDQLFTTLPDGLWKIRKAKDSNSYLISLHKTADDKNPYKYAIANKNFMNCQIVNNNGQGQFNPLGYPFDELTLSGYLNINKVGFFLHSAMVLINGKGLLFAGMPGSGKSSIAELCLQDKDCDVLTDERVIIREKDGIIYAFGTPWHSTLPVYKNKGAPVHRIFFIKHGEKNSLQNISTFDAANRLMVRCFPTFWHKEGMQFALDFCTRIASEIECYEFSFVPDETAIKFVKEVI
jgi:hypothetical protein